MPFQNRVTPFGQIVALPGRGTLTGNRGILHNEQKHIVRSSATRRWIACRLEFKGWHREIMEPGRWTQLFFLDEAAALSAGHRPCAECRNADYKRFRSLFETCFGAPASAEAMDMRFHGERIQGRAKRTYRAGIAGLPGGTYIAIDGTAWLVWNNELLRWSDSGYDARKPRPSTGDVDVLTPRSIVAILDAGYVPAIHSSAS